MHQPKRILVAPLNWGLGHATRCIPIIWELQAQGAEVFLASDGRALDLLGLEFPHLPIITLPSYGIQYRSENAFLNLAMEMPKLIRAVFLENRALQKTIQQYGLHGVISDNRLGCFSKKIPCAFITHQIDLKLPNRPVQWLARQANYRFIARFNECWVPDVPGEPNLSGRLSHGTPLDGKLHFIGALSRMSHFPKEKAPKNYDVIAVISGPEPQRSNLEAAILEQASALPYHFLVVQGKTEEDKHFFIGKNIEVVSRLGSEALNSAILAGRVFVGRSGYSSVMDLARLGKPAFFIPTPGQTEQAYLAELYAQSGIFHSQRQADFNLKKGIETALQRGSLDGRFFTQKKMKETVRDFLQRC